MTQVISKIFSQSMLSKASVSSKAGFGKIIPPFIIFGGMIALGALFSGCKKENPSITYEGHGTCMCVPHDYTADYLIMFLNKLPEDDTSGRAQFEKWFEENVNRTIEDPDCCQHTVPSDPDFYERCQEWIDNYLSGTAQQLHVSG